MLYNSKIHGECYRVFYRYIAGEHPTFIFIRDENNYIFGAYVDVAWTKGSNFFGGDGCFLFRLKPAIVICQAYGINKNYCYLNYDDNRNPVGVAFGGDKDFFGLHFDFNTRRGKAADFCSSYENFECLPEYNYFQIKDIEVWNFLPDETEVSSYNLLSNMNMDVPKGLVSSLITLYKAGTTVNETKMIIFEQYMLLTSKNNS